MNSDKGTEHGERIAEFMDGVKTRLNNFSDYIGGVFRSNTKQYQSRGELSKLFSFNFTEDSVVDLRRTSLHAFLGIKVINFVLNNQYYNTRDTESILGIVQKQGSLAFVGLFRYYLLVEKIHDYRLVISDLFAGERAKAMYRLRVNAITDAPVFGAVLWAGTEPRKLTIAAVIALLGELWEGGKLNDSLVKKFPIFMRHVETTGVLLYLIYMSLASINNTKMVHEAVNQEQMPMTIQKNAFPQLKTQDIKENTLYQKILSTFSLSEFTFEQQSFIHNDQFGKVITINGKRFAILSDIDLDPTDIKKILVSGTHPKSKTSDWFTITRPKGTINKMQGGNVNYIIAINPKAYKTDI